MKNIVKLGLSVVMLAVLFGLQPVWPVFAEQQAESAAAAGESVLTLAAAPLWAQLLVAGVAGLVMLLALAPAAGLTTMEK